MSASESCSYRNMQLLMSLSCKSDGGNGPIPLFRESVLARGEATLLLFQALPSLSLEDITILGKTKAMHT